ncbi:hypothetical protein [Echinicola sp. 20G]|uniref:hypothetical protein n=1 Tax=Echinicola sp. 20G TaxID=2781961 RepID=UPI001911222F|nr:hypothetical protein [Echinicola sp. 20G]
MNKFRFLVFILLLSCKQTVYKQKIEGTELAISLLEHYILADSLHLRGYISPKLKAYKYYELEFTSDSLSFPPPYGYEWKNETALNDEIGNDTYFGDSASKSHVKHQIINAKDQVKKFKLTSFENRKAEMEFQKDSSWYVFYLPIFNEDSSAAYMQYDHYHGGFGEGNAAIYIKQAGEWEYHEFIPGWIN